MMRSLPSGCSDSSAKQSSPPAMATSSDTQRMALMCGSSHSSKIHLGPARQRGRGLLDRRQPGAHALQQDHAARLLAHHRRHLVQHGEDLGHAALVEHRDLHAMADQLRGDVGLQVGKAEHAVGPQFQDLVDLGREEGADLGLFLACPARPHRVAGDADDARLLAEQVQPLGGLLGEADDALRARGEARSAIGFMGVALPAVRSSAAR